MTVEYVPFIDIPDAPQLARLRELWSLLKAKSWHTEYDQRLRLFEGNVLLREFYDELAKFPELKI